MISQTALHTIKAMAVLAESPGEFQGAGNIADRIGAPRNYLGKLMQNLVAEGLLHSQKGKGGGFRLARSPERISLFEVVEPVDHVSRWDGCFLGRSACDAANPCALHSKWADVRDSYLAMLKTSNLGDLVGGGESLPCA